jgi:hypothetical protein
MYIAAKSKANSNVRENIPNADGIPQKCEICGEIIKSDINERIKHNGDKHYDSLSEPAKESYDNI